MTLASTAVRSATGQFAPGHSGNPAGRPKGARNKATVFAEMLREGQAEEIVQKFVARALGGDAVALRVCFERLVAKAGPAPIQLDLAPGAESDPASLVTATIRGLADGEVTPQEAAAVARVAVAAQKVLGTAGRQEAAVGEECATMAEEAALILQEAAPAAAEAPPPAAAGSGPAPAPTPVIRLFPLDAPLASGASAEPTAHGPEAAAAGPKSPASPVSGQFAPAPARRSGTVRGFIAARRSA